MVTMTEWGTPTAGQWMRRGRTQLDLTQTEFADRLRQVGGHDLRVDGPMVSRWERSLHSPDARYRKAIRRLLGRPPWENLALKAELSAPGQPVDSEEMRRRELLAQLGLLGFSGVVGARI